MKIKAVRLRQVGMFQNAVALEGFSGQLDILAGDNEFGKSTIFRALQALFLAKHTSKTAALADLAPRDGGAPLIEADFEQAGELWRITKQFGRSTNATLQSLSNDSAILRKADAEDRLAELLGVDDRTPAGRFNLLWVAQKHGLGRPDMDLDSLSSKDKSRGDSAILRAIESQVATVAGGPLARNVRRAVQTKLDELVSSRGPRAGGPLDIALRERDKFERELLEARERAARTATSMIELGHARSRENELKAPGVRKTLEARVQEARAQAAEVSTITQTVKAALAQRDASRHKLGSARTSLKAFDDDLENFTVLNERADAEEKKRKQLEADLNAADRAYQAAKEATGQLRMDDKRLAKLSVARAQFDQSAQDELTLNDATANLDAVQSLETTIATTRKALTDDPLTQTVVDELSSLEHKVGVLEAHLAAASPTIDIALTKTAKGRIRVDGTALANDVAYTLAKPMTIDIDGIGTVRVTPGHTEDRDAQQQKLSGIRAALEGLLKKVAAPNLKAARTRFKDRQKRELSLSEALAKRSALAPDGIDAIKQQVGRLNDALTRAQADAGEAPPTLPELRDQAAKVSAKLEQAAKTLTNAQSARDDLWKTLEALKARAVVRETRLIELAQKLGGTDLRAMKRTEMSKAVATLTEETSKAERACDALPQIPTQPEIEKLQADLNQAGEALKAHDEEVSNLREQISGLENLIQGADGDGTGLRVAQLEGELQRAASQVTRLEDDVEALKLLQATLIEAASNAKAQISAPIMARLTPYLEHLFPGANITFADRLRLEGLQRQNSTEQFDTLSDGTMEQLAIVVRLAYARLLSETGNPVPLFLDDPLAYCDDTRLQRVFNALHEGATIHQVIVFTCHKRAFETLDGNHVHLTPWTNPP